MATKKWITPLLAAGLWVLFTGWTVQFAERQMRSELLTQTTLIARAIDTEHVQGLTGTEADVNSPNYLQLKTQFASLMKASESYRFIYLMGSRDDGTLFFFVDDSAVGSEDEAPAGMIYDDAPDGFRRVLKTGRSEIVGPFTDRWGTYVSGCVVVTDPKSGQTLAALAVDFRADDWTLHAVSRAAIPALLGLALLITVGMSLATYHHFLCLKRTQESLCESEMRLNKLVSSARTPSL